MIQPAHTTQARLHFKAVEQLLLDWEKALQEKRRATVEFFRTGRRVKVERAAERLHRQERQLARFVFQEVLGRKPR